MKGPAFTNTWKRTPKKNSDGRRRRKSQRQPKRSLQNDLHHYERENRTYGITYEDKNYRFSTLNVDVDKFEGLEQELMEVEQALEEVEDLRGGEEEKVQAQDIGDDSELEL